MKNRSLGCLRALTVISLVGAGSAAAGCSTAEVEDTVSPTVANRSSSLLSQGIKSIDGVYGAGCGGHVENEPWSAAIDDQAALTHATLRVRRNDASCTLKLTHVRKASESFAATPAVTLSNAYGSPSAFNNDDQTAVDFYGSAKLGDATFASNFSIDLLLTAPTSDGEPDLNFPDGYEPSFTVSEGDVAAPDFGISTSNHTLFTDENNVVTTSSGYIELVLNSHSAQTYAVIHGLLSSGMSPDDLASQIQSAPHSGAVSSPYRIQAADLDLVGVDLTNGASRSIILRNTEEGMSSYQVLRLRFAAGPAWTAEEWGTCSASCGGGTQTRAVKCQQNGTDVDSSNCIGTPPATSQACNEDSCAVELGAMHINGTCGVLGVLGPGFTLTAGPTTALPAGTAITITGSGVANIGVFSVTGGTAAVSVLSGTSRQILLTAALPAGATIAFRTTLSISVAFTLNATISLPGGYVSNGGKSAGSVTSTLILCSAS